MRLSACITIYNRMPEISWSVADSLSLRGNLPDELIVVLDRPSKEVLDGAVDAYSTLNEIGVDVRFVKLRGPSGWRCPSFAWNRAFAAATGDIVFCFSSEIIQRRSNMDEVRHNLSRRRRVLFGKVTCSCGPKGHAVEWDGTPCGNVMSSALKPSPVGYSWAAPASLVRSIGGFDQAFNKGVGYEDLDFFVRLWDIGIDFEFTDKIVGMHICHDRDSKQSQETDDMARINLGIFMERHGTLDPWSKIDKLVESNEQSVVWRHK